MHVDYATMAEDILRETPVLLNKLEAACGASEAEAREGLVEVLRFLGLCVHAQMSLTPSPRVDRAWHELILCTRQYALLCAAVFGRFVHHEPGGSDAINRARFRETLRLYHHHYGAPSAAWWGAPHAAVADCGPCKTFEE